MWLLPSIRCTLKADYLISTKHRSTKLLSTLQLCSLLDHWDYVCFTSARVSSKCSHSRSGKLGKEFIRRYYFQGSLIQNKIMSRQSVVDLGLRTEVTYVQIKVFTYIQCILRMQWNIFERDGFPTYWWIMYLEHAVMLLKEDKEI